MQRISKQILTSPIWVFAMVEQRIQTLCLKTLYHLSPFRQPTSSPALDLKRTLEPVLGPACMSCVLHVPDSAHESLSAFWNVVHSSLIHLEDTHLIFIAKSKITCKSYPFPQPRPRTEFKDILIHTLDCKPLENRKASQEICISISWHMEDR